MSGIKCLLATAIIMLMLTAPALAQFNPWPSPLPPAPGGVQLFVPERRK